MKLKHKWSQNLLVKPLLYEFDDQLEKKYSNRNRRKLSCKHTFKHIYLQAIRTMLNCVMNGTQVIFKNLKKLKTYFEQIIWYEKIKHEWLLQTGSLFILKTVVEKHFTCNYKSTKSYHIRKCWCCKLHFLIIDRDKQKLVGDIWKFLTHNNLVLAPCCNKFMFLHMCVCDALWRKRTMNSSVIKMNNSDWIFKF